MNPVEWERAKELFERTREMPVEDRPAFLESECSLEPALRQQVERLLAAYDTDFLEESILPKAVDQLANSNFQPDQVIGRYRIGDLIGTGGMGQVFRAEDTELDRPVAFKVLHSDIAENDERVRRFIQEAKAASALNHPNILTIHEIGSFEGARFIVSEYVDGETLRERMRRGLTSAESLEIMCQIAAALQAAHSAGIVHRDIKPENIMLRQDGLVKVLDFGLAKLTEADDLPIDPDSPTLSRLQTSPGLIMGTVAYMSPEQARGQAVDSRTDLWSLGVVFHEMLTGESPFKGESVTDLVTSILSHDMASLDVESISQELKPICAKALAKDKNVRYQTAQDLLQDLQGEKKRMEYAIQPTPYITVSSTDEMKTQLIRRRPTLSAEYIVTSVKRHKYATFMTLAMILISGISLSVYKYNGATPPDPGQNLAAINDSTTERDLKFSKLPISGEVDSIAISPDGKYVAYMPAAGTGLRLLELATSVDTELSGEGYNWAPIFSPDSKFVYYTFSTEAPVAIEFKKLSVSGGPPVKVPANPDSFSPDGATMVFTRDRGQTVMVANSDGSNERLIAKIALENRIANRLVFSPDGKTLAGQMSFKDEQGTFMRLVGFDVADGKQQVLNDKRWNSMMGVVWLPNGNLVAVAREDYSEPAQLWLIPPAGEPKAITSGMVGYQGLSATSKGEVLLTRQLSATNVDSSDLWIADEKDVNKTKRITTSSELQGRFTWSPDGRIIMCSDVSGNRDIWIMNSDGSGRKQLTNDPGGDVQPAVSPDGKYIAFTSNRVSGVDQIFRMDINGGSVKQLTQGKQKVLASFSADGKWVYFVELSSKTIQRVPTDGGESTVIMTAPDGWDLAGIDVNKADGRLVYGLIRFSKGWENKLGILPTKGEGKLIDVSATLDVGRPRWAPDGRMVNVLSKETRDIWSLPVDGKGKPRQITDFNIPGTRGFSWSVNGKQLLVGRQSLTITPVLIRKSGN